MKGRSAPPVLWRIAASHPKQTSTNRAATVVARSNGSLERAASMR